MVHKRQSGQEEVLLWTQVGVNVESLVVSLSHIWTHHTRHWVLLMSSLESVNVHLYLKDLFLILFEELALKFQVLFGYQL